MRKLWTIGVVLPLACAPYARPCNSDDDCLGAELCAQGQCALVVEREAAADEHVVEVDPPRDQDEPGIDEVNQANQAPVLLFDAARVRAQSPTVLPITVFDPDGDAVSTIVMTPPSHGSIDGIVYTSFEEGDDEFLLAPVDARGLQGTPVEIKVTVLPSDWADVELLRRARVRILPQAGQTEIVSGVAVLVELSAADLGVSFLDDARAIVRFIDDDGSVLPAELDHDTGDIMSFWVRPGDIDATSGTSDGFFIYAGGSSTLSEPSPSDVWLDYLAVWHFIDDRFADQLDSARGRAAENFNGSARAGLCRVGGCMTFDGNNDVLHLRGDVPELAGATQVTLSGTVRLKSVKVGVVVGFSNGAFRSVERVRLGINDLGVPSMRFTTSDSSSPGVDVSMGPTLDVGVDYQLDATLNLDTGRLRIFVDGEMVGVSDVTPGVFPSTASLRGAIGATTDDDPHADIDAHVDEVRVSLDAHHPEVVRVDAASRAGALTIVEP